jgi:hypothetical protein
VHNISFNFLLLFFLPEADQLLVVLLVQFLHQELGVETVLILTVYEVLHDLLLFSLTRCIIRGWGYYDSLRHFTLCPGNFDILMIYL